MPDAIDRVVGAMEFEGQRQSVRALDLPEFGPEQVEPLQVADVNFHVTKSIDQCPPGLQARELLMNAIEAQALPEERGIRKIRLYALPLNRVTKLAMLNSGHGMTAEELVRATDLASSIRKMQGLEGRMNRGEGAKVASLPWNHAGLRFRSCRRGVVSEVWLARVNGMYVRRREKVEDDRGEIVGFDPVWDVTETARAEGSSTSPDWTEVVCLGREEDQDTTRWPYGVGQGSGQRRAVLTEIFDRFYSLPKHVALEADESLHGRKGSTTFRLMHDVIEKWGNDHSKLRSERVRIGNGVEIEYVHTPSLSGGNTVMGAHELTGDATRAAIVWHGEMYDAKIGPEWRHIAAGFALPHVHREFSIFIHLSANAPVKDGPYRMDLRDAVSGEKLEIEDYRDQVRTFMPAWVKTLVAQALQPRQASDMSAVRQELERRLREARVRTNDLNRQGTQRPAEPIEGRDQQKLPVVTVIAGGGTERSRHRSISGTPTILDPDAPKPAVPRAQAAGSPVKRRRAVQLVSTAPEIIWLDDEAKVESEELRDRAGKYDLATNTLYLNALYRAVRGKIEDLEAHYAQQVDWEKVQGLVTDKVRAAMALHIGSVVVYALAKQGLQTWTETDWRAAFSKESLTIAADLGDHLLGEIRQALSVTAQFKAARAV